MNIQDFITPSPIYKRALTLANHGKAAPYERLEFLGDRVLGLMLADMLYHHFPQETEGDWAMRFTILAQEKTLAEIAKSVGVPALLETNEQELRQNSSILADVLEALIAAIYLDQGTNKAKTFVNTLWAPYLNQSHQSIKDSKSALQEWAQKHQKMPVYNVISRTGPDHAPTFVVEASVAGFGAQSAQGSSKKEASALAAKLLLEKLETLNNHKKDKK